MAAFCGTRRKLIGTAPPGTLERPIAFTTGVWSGALWRPSSMLERAPLGKARSLTVDVSAFVGRQPPRRQDAFTAVVPEVGVAGCSHVAPHRLYACPVVMIRERRSLSSPTGPSYNRCRGGTGRRRPGLEDDYFGSCCTYRTMTILVCGDHQLTAKKLTQGGHFPGRRLAPRS